MARGVRAAAWREKHGESEENRKQQRRQAGVKSIKPVVIGINGWQLNVVSMANQHHQQYGQ